MHARLLSSVIRIKAFYWMFLYCINSRTESSLCFKWCKTKQKTKTNLFQSLESSHCPCTGKICKWELEQESCGSSRGGWSITRWSPRRHSAWRSCRPCAGSDPSAVTLRAGVALLQDPMPLSAPCVRYQQLEEASASLRERIRHLDDMVHCQQKKVKQMVEEVSHCARSQARIIAC